MLTSRTFPMHGANGVVQLSDVLSTLGGEDLEWSIVYFSGLGTGPNGMAMPEFEALVRSLPLGFRMSWTDLREFASALWQTIECVIVAARSIADLLPGDLQEDDFHGCELVIQAQDSTEWIIGKRE